MVASYDHRGQHLYVGNSKGKVTVLTVSKVSKEKEEDKSKDESKEKKGEEEKKRKEGEDTEFKVVSAFRVTQQVTFTTAIKSIEFARRSKSFLVNTADRVIRVYKTKDVLGLKGDFYGHFISRSST